MRKQKGFTLIEVIIAFVIVAIMAAGTLPALSNITRQSFQSEINLNLPSVAQATLNGESSATSIYTMLADNVSASATVIGNGITKYTATAASKGYKYAIDTLYANVGVGLGSLGSAPGPQEITTTPSTSTTASTVVITPTTSTTVLQFTGSTLWTQKTCTFGLKGDAHDDTVTYGDQYMEIRAGSDGIINYGLTFWVPSDANGNNYIIIAIPGNTDVDSGHSKDKDKEYSYVAFENKHMNTSSTATPTPPNSLKEVCEVQNGVNGNPVWLPSASTTKEGLGDGGAFLFPAGSSNTTVVYQYKLSAHVDSKAAWNLSFSIKFLQGTPTANQWVRVYIPGNTGEVTKVIPATTDEVIVTNNFYEPFTFSVYQPTVQGLVAWDNVTFDVSSNASVTIEVKTDSMSTYYLFHATGPATQMKINLRQYPLSPLEALEARFTVSPIDITKRASVNNVGIFFWQASMTP
jgi:prepilin-type N-terminal cleavage/methylation domain-containing protein